MLKDIPTNPTATVPLPSPPADGEDAIARAAALFMTAWFDLYGRGRLDLPRNYVALSPEAGVAMTFPAASSLDECVRESALAGCSLAMRVYSPSGAVEHEYMLYEAPAPRGGGRAP